MKDNYLIQILGTVVTDGDEEKIDLTTTGSFYKKEDKYYVCYDESAATGFDGSKTCVKVWDSGASITRFGRYKSCLMIEQGMTNLCNYDTPAGSLVLDINGIEINSNLTEKGGEVNLSYTLNSGGLLLSENTLKMNIKEL